MTRASASPSSTNSGRRVKHSRNGCVSCKKRRVRCSGKSWCCTSGINVLSLLIYHLITEERPVCARCICNGIQCEYKIRLIWEDESSERGIKHGRRKHREASFIDPTPSSELLGVAQWNRLLAGKVHFLNTTGPDIDGVPVKPFTPLDLMRAAYMPRLKCAPAVLDLPRSDGMLFQYCKPHSLVCEILSSYIQDQEEVCPSLTLVNDSSNCYRQIILPLSVTSDSVMISLLAVAALYLSLGDTEGYYYAAALGHKQRALSALRRALASSNGALSKNQILVSMLMLCLFDVSPPIPSL
jgi:hypothetical protein